MSRKKRITTKRSTRNTKRRVAPTKGKYARASKRKSRQQTKFGISDILSSLTNTLSHKKEKPITALVPYTQTPINTNTGWEFWQPPPPKPSMLGSVVGFIGQAIPIVKYVSNAVGLGFQGYNLVKMILAKLNKNPLDYDTRRTNQMIDTMQRKLIERNPDYQNDDIFAQFEDLRRLLYMIDNMQGSGQIGGIDQVIANATEGLKSVLVRFNQLMSN